MFYEHVKIYVLIGRTKCSTIICCYQQLHVTGQPFFVYYVCKFMIFLSAQNLTIINLPSSSVTRSCPLVEGSFLEQKTQFFINIVEKAGSQTH